MIAAHQTPAIDFLCLPYKERLRLGSLRHELNCLKRNESTAAQVRKYLSGNERNEFESSKFVDPRSQPDELDDYQRMVKQADLANARANTYFKKKNSSAAKRERAKAERGYEVALERLRELLESDPKLEDAIKCWLDRDVTFETGSEPSPDCVGIPRLITSKSMYRRDADKCLTDKNQPLINYVEKLINSYNWPESV